MITTIIIIVITTMIIVIIIIINNNTKKIQYLLGHVSSILFSSSQWLNSTMRFICINIYYYPSYPVTTQTHTYIIS